MGDELLLTPIQCGKVGHIARNCTDGGYGGGGGGFGGRQGGGYGGGGFGSGGGGGGGTTCYTCGGYGHMSRDCTQGQKCYNCKNGQTNVSMSMTDILQAARSAISRESALLRRVRSVFATVASNPATCRLSAPTDVFADMTSQEPLLNTTTHRRHGHWIDLDRQPELRS